MSQGENMIICQSGGPTAVINASLVGAYHKAVETEKIDHIYGGFNGIMGVLKEELIDLNQQQERTMEGIKFTPSSALGSSRYKLAPNLDHDDYDRIFEVFDAHDIGYFFYNGGNDSMDTAMKLNQYAEEIGYDINIIGIPKTIDNDLMGTDNCPGFGSAAKYINTSILEAAYDCHTYSRDTILIMETMGRHSGWLAASTALATHKGERIPDLIYLPEVPFDLDKFIEEVREIYQEQRMVFLTVSEGIVDNKGKFISARQSEASDQFGHKNLGGVSLYLQGVIEENICDRVKIINPGILQRSAAHCASKTDLDEAYWAGYRGVDFARKGYSGFMAAIKRNSNKPFQWQIDLIPLDKVANKEKQIPKKWINSQGNYITQEAIDYMKPLIQGNVHGPAWEGLPRYFTLEQNFISKKLKKWSKD